MLRVGGLGDLLRDVWGSEAADTEDLLVSGHQFNRHRAFVRVYHDPIQWDGSRGHRCYEQSNPFLSHSDPAVPGTTQAMREPHQPVGSR